MNNIILITVPVLLNVLIRTSAENLVINPNKETTETSSSFIFDDHELQNIANQVQLLKEVTDNMRLKMELNTFSLQKELQEIKELLSKEHAIEVNKSTKDCSKNNPSQVPLPSSLAQEFASLKSEIIENIQRSFVDCRCNQTDRLSDVNNLLKSEIEDVIAGNVTNEINKVQLQMNELSTSVKSEIANFRETIQPQINNITNITLSLQNVVEGKSLLLPTNQQFANITDKSQQYPSCVEALQNGGQSGIYKLDLPFSVLKPFDVYCLRDPMNGPAWTVVQRRQDGLVDFARTWEEYNQGFGDLKSEFFLGLNKLYALTNQAKPQQLWIQLADWEGDTKFAKYTAFMIGNEAAKYNIAKLGTYSGDAGDSLDSHRGKKFSTQDSDNDDINLNCAEYFKGGWWFSGCGYCHLNGKYSRGELASNNARGVEWYHWRGFRYGLKYAHMAIRPGS